jgi:hypothetical protein
MNLEQTISVLPILEAGGSGSGPNAPCPQCGPHSGYKSTKGHDIEEKDIVRINKPDSLYNFKTGNIDKFESGKLKGVVVNVLPKIGDNPSMVRVNILPPTKKHEQDNTRYFKISDVQLHKLGNTDQVKDIKPVSKGKVISKFKTADGATVTWVKPQAVGEKEIKDPTKEQHYLKGKFEQTESTKGLQDRPGYVRVTKIYDTTGMPNYFQKGSNSTVYVNTYSQKGAIKNVVIQEQNTTTYGQKTRFLSFSYKNAAAASGMLQSRYGITAKLKNLGKAKFGI